MVASLIKQWQIMIRVAKHDAKVLGAKGKVIDSSNKISAETDNGSEPN